MNDKLLTPREVAQQLRVSNMTAYRLIKRKELHVIRVGHQYRVPEQALADYLKGQQA